LKFSKQSFIIELRNRFDTQNYSMNNSYLLLKKIYISIFCTIYGILPYIFGIIYNFLGEFTSICTKKKKALEIISGGLIYQYH
jgi:hypothetical protein